MSFWSRLTIRVVAATLLLAVALFAASPVEYVLEVLPSANVPAVASKYGLTIVRSWSSTNSASYVVSSPQALKSTVLAAIRLEPGIREVEQNVEIHSEESQTSKSKVNIGDLAAAMAVTGNSQFYGVVARNAYVAQRATSIIRSSPAHSRYGGGSGSVVAVIDTGVDPNHPLLRNSLLPGYDFTRDLPGTANEMADLSQSTVAILDQSTVAILDQSTVAILDRLTLPVLLNQSTVAILDLATAIRLKPNSLPAAFGHGTMVAGLIHLVAPQARILPLKAFRADGSSSLADIVRAIRYAVDQNATVISMSFSLSTPSVELKSALDYAASKGVVCVSSAGNDGKEVKVYPAAWKYVIGVGSTNARDRRSAFSNYGDSARTAAPGEALITTYPGGHYAAVWGTSFSTALVSGALADVRQTCPGASVAKMLDILDAGPHIGQDMGGARLDVLASLGYCQGIR